MRVDVDDDNHHPECQEQPEREHTFSGRRCALLRGSSQFGQQVSACDPALTTGQPGRCGATLRRLGSLQRSSRLCSLGALIATQLHAVNADSQKSPELRPTHFADIRSSSDPRTSGAAARDTKGDHAESLTEKDMTEFRVRRNDRRCRGPLSRHSGNSL